MQGTWVRALLQEDPTCCGATKPVHHNYWACTLEPASHNYWARVPQLLKPVCLEPMLYNKRSNPMRSPRTATKSSPRSLQLYKSLHAAAKTQRSQKWKINKLKKKKDTLNQMDLIDINRTFHPKTTEYTFFSSAHGTFSRIDHILGHKSSLGKLRKSKSYQVFFPTTTLWD